MQKFWENASIEARFGRYYHGFQLQFYNPSKIEIESPAMLEKARMLEKKFDKLYNKLESEEEKKKLFHKYRMIFDKEKKSESDPHFHQVLELIFNILYGELLKMEKEISQGLDEAEKMIDEELKQNHIEK